MGCGRIRTAAQQCSSTSESLEEHHDFRKPEEAKTGKINPMFTNPKGADEAAVVNRQQPAHDSSEEELLEKMQQAHGEILREIRREIIGQDNVVEQVLISLFVGGHSIITGVPGLAKTLLIRTLARVLDLKFNRIQFTPDLMPADITGTDIIEEDHTTGRRTLVFVKGPIFANIILADEINRTPPKTQSALLEAMQEYSVTVQGVTYDLKQPFYVLATQNPIELEGTYPLPEAQLDRFMFNILIDYLSESDEIQVVKETTSLRSIHYKPLIGGADIVEFQKVGSANSRCRFGHPLCRSVGSSLPSR